MTPPPTPTERRPSLPPAESWLEGVPLPTQRRLDRVAVAAFVTALPGLVPISAVLAVAAWLRIRRTGHRGRGLVIGAALLCLGWIIAIVVAALLGLYGERQAGIGRSVPIATVQVGQCFDADLTSGSQLLRTVRIADCAAPHTGEAYAQVSALVAGLSEADQGKVATQQCAAAFEGFVGKPYAGSELDMYYVALAGRAVADGNVLCLVGLPGTQLTGSMRGSGR